MTLLKREFSLIIPKLADVSPIFKKEDGFKKQNYRPFSILPHISKVFETILYK